MLITYESSFILSVVSFHNFVSVPVVTFAAVTLFNSNCATLLVVEVNESETTFNEESNLDWIAFKDVSTFYLIVVFKSCIDEFILPISVDTYVYWSVIDYFKRVLISLIDELISVSFVFTVVLIVVSNALILLLIFVPISSLTLSIAFDISLILASICEFIPTYNSFNIPVNVFSSDILDKKSSTSLNVSITPLISSVSTNLSNDSLKLANDVFNFF